MNDHGEKNIRLAISGAQEHKLAALMPYFTIGYPTIDESLKIISAIASQSDLLELGVPFSDPIADGKTVQRSSQRALENGVTTAICLQLVRSLRNQGIDIPVLLMGYYNPILAYGEEKFVNDAADSGVDGFIVPDLPPEEAGSLKVAATKRGLALIYFVAPTSNQHRIELVASEATGFIYVVSVTGVTGARKKLEMDLAQLVAQVRARSNLPVAVGFGISTPAQAAEVGRYADGVIVGSALIDAVDRGGDKALAASEFVGALNAGLAKE